jgi:hypothetical protein
LRVDDKDATHSASAFDPDYARIMHWIDATSIICMMLSGWAIYNASPSLPFTSPGWMTLGGWLAGGIAWHITVSIRSRLSVLPLPQRALSSRPGGYWEDRGYEWYAGI